MKLEIENSNNPDKEEIIKILEETEANFSNK